LFDIPRSTFYDRRSKPVDEEQQALSQRIVSIFKESRGSAGSRTIVSILRAEDTTVSRFKVMRLMEDAGLQSKQPGSHSYKVATVERVDIPNTLARNFKPERPNQVWTGDITYIWAGRWVYLAVVLDLYKRRVVGYAMSDKADAALAIAALAMAWHGNSVVSQKT
jgi:transposase InsO family protein